MNLVGISWAQIKSKPLDTGLSLLLLGFGVGIISLMLLLEVQLREQFERNIKDIDLVLGAKGSPLQLILSSVYQVDAPTGNIPVKEAQRVMKHPYIESAIPLAYGDNYQKYRIVGTTPAYLEHYGAVLADGKVWEESFEAVLGSQVAKETGMKLGDKFYSSHGLDDAGESHEDHAFTVVGILEGSGTVVDQLILTKVNSIWEVHEHAESDSLPPQEREYTAVLLKKKNPLAIISIPGMLKDSQMQVALPAVEINRLNENFGLGMSTVRAIALIIMALSFVSVFISLYNSLKSRKYELALMRSMGGTRFTLFRLILQEGLLLTVLGCLLGLVLSRLGLWILSNAMEDSFHYHIGKMGLLPTELLLVGISIFVGILASFLPAWKAVRMDISKTLADG